MWPCFSSTWHKKLSHAQLRHSQSPHYGGCTKKPASPTQQATLRSNSYAKPCVASIVDQSTANRHSALCNSRKSFHARRVTVPPWRISRQRQSLSSASVGFLRWDDMKTLKRDSLDFCDTHMTIHFGKRKNYQLRDCEDLLIARGTRERPPMPSERHSAVSYRRQAHAVRPTPSKGHRKQEPPSRLPPGSNVLLTLPGTGEASPGTRRHRLDRVRYTQLTLRWHYGGSTRPRRRASDSALRRMEIRLVEELLHKRLLGGRLVRFPCRSTITPKSSPHYAFPVVA